MRCAHEYMAHEDKGHADRATRTWPMMTGHEDKGREDRATRTWLVRTGPMKTEQALSSPRGSSPPLRHPLLP